MLENSVKHTNPYTLGLEKNEANFVCLSPLSFIERSAFVYPDRAAVIHGDWQITWKESYARCRRLASRVQEALAALQPLHRQLVSLAFVRGYTQSEIAEQTGLPLGTVKSHIRRGLTLMKLALDPVLRSALPKKGAA